MAAWRFLYPLVVIALFGVAIYEHIKATTLSLPLSPALTILTILLPLLGLANTLYHSNIASTKSPLSLPPSSLSSSPSSSPPNSLHKYLPTALQIAQLLVTTILATLFSSSSSSPGIRDCLLSTRWKDLWTSHDGERLRRIQDALDCCGFRTPKDMAWPFPHGSPHDGQEHVTCVARYGRRDKACKGPWEDALGGVAWGEVGVLVGVVVLQAVGVWWAARFNGQADGSNSSWWDGLVRWFNMSRGSGRERHGGRGRGDSASGRLLVGGDQDGGRVVDIDEEGGDGESYQDVGGNHHGRGQRNGGNGYGAAGHWGE